jgi:prolipoprotein diacylglyceryltransferase
VLYAVMRFLIEFVRADVRGDILGLTTRTGLSTSQLIALVVGAASLVLLIVRWRRAASAAGEDEQPAPAPHAAKA